MVEDMIAIIWYIWLNSFEVINVAERDIHIIFLAIPTGKMKPFLYSAGGLAEKFWPILKV